MFASVAPASPLLRGTSDSALNNHRFLEFHWPHMRVQSEQASLLLTRHVSWSDIMRGLHAYLAEVSHIEMLYARAHSRMIAALPDLNTDFGGLVSGMAQLKAHAQTTEEQHSSAGAAVDKSAVRLLERAEQQVVAEVNAVLAEMNRLEVILSQERGATLQAHDVFVRAYEAAAAVADAFAAAPGGVLEPTDIPAVDPWLCDMQLTLQVERLRNADRAYNTALRGLYRELAKMDAYCMEVVKEATLCLPILAASLLEDSSAHLSIAAKYFCELLPGDEFDTWAASCNMNRDNVGSFVMHSFEYANKNGPLVRVVRQGSAMRRVGAMKTSWKPVTLVVTQAGFLHCYEVSDKSLLDARTNPAFSVYLYGRLSVESRASSLTLELTLLSASRFTAQRSLTLMFTNESELSMWDSTIRMKTIQPSTAAPPAPVEASEPDLGELLDDDLEGM